VAGPVYTALIGPNVTPHFVSVTPYQHENVLRTVLDALEIPVHPGASAAAHPMTEFFAGYVTVTSPAPNSVSGMQVPVSATAPKPPQKIYQLQVWDKGTGRKLAESAPGTSAFRQT